ncbi:MAG: cytochrome b/b6 domain-containing protein [Ideonella sp.]|nr:cytochrome b/b6 domain-containing protein [Ideonella sp.]
MTKLYVNPLPVRIWHWTNAIGFVLLILTGLQIRYVGQFEACCRSCSAVVLHNWIGFVLIANFFIWRASPCSPTRSKILPPELSPVKYFDQLPPDAVLRLGVLGSRSPHHVSVYRKFNALQSMMYQIIMMLSGAATDRHRRTAVGRGALRHRGRTPGRRARGGHRARAAVHLLLRLHHRARVPGQPGAYAEARTSRR